MCINILYNVQTLYDKSISSTLVLSHFGFLPSVEIWEILHEVLSTACTSEALVTEIQPRPSNDTKKEFRPSKRKKVSWCLVQR